MIFDFSFDPEELSGLTGLTGLGRVSATVESVEKALGLKSRGDGVRLKPFAGRDGTGKPALESSAPAVGF